MNDFERIAAVIRYLDARHTTQPSLGELADAAGLSGCSARVVAAPVALGLSVSIRG